MSDCILATRWKATGYGSGQENHRVVWIIAHGPIPKGFDVDHVCHNEDETCTGGTTCVHRRCYNLEHLRLVLHVTNLNAGQTFSPENNARRSTAVRAHWEAVDKSPLIGKGRADAELGYSKPFARATVTCAHCFRQFKGIRGLNAHYTKAHT